MIPRAPEASSSLRIDPAPPSSLLVERRARVSRETFALDYLQGGGRPVVITDAMDGWPAHRKWNSYFFSERYGSDVVVVTDILGCPNVARQTTLAAYLDYVRCPIFSPLSTPAPPAPLYLNNYSPFVTHPELLEDFDDPYFIENFYRRMPAPYRDWYNQGFGWIFIGPAGASTPWHVDLFGTHAWLAQIEGRKQFWLSEPAVPTGAGEPQANDPSTGLAERAPGRILEVTLGPGEVLFIPAGWPHQVTCLSSSISLTFNFVNGSNFAAHLMGICRDLPGWAKKVNQPLLRDAGVLPWTNQNPFAAGAGAEALAPRKDT